MKKSVLVLLLLFSALAAVSAEQITKVGVVDLDSIFNRYFASSKGVRALEEKKKNFLNGRDERSAEIAKLEEKKLKAQNDDNQDLVLQLEGEISLKVQQLKDYNRVMLNQLKMDQEELMRQSDFSRELKAEITNIAQTQGYSLIIYRNDPNLLYYSSEVDITELVLQALIKN